MKRKKKITEEDVRATEARIRESLNGIKKAIVAMPSDAAKPVTDTVRKHPFLTVAASVGAGFLLYRLITSLKPRTKIIIREKGGRQQEFREPAKPSLLSKIMSEATTLAMPYITSYVQKEVANLLSGAKATPEESERETVTGPGGH